MQAQRPLPAPEYDLVQTVAGLRMGRSDPCLRLAGQRAQLAFHTPEGPVGLDVRQGGDALQIESWGEGSAWALARVDGLLGLGDRADLFQPVAGPVADLWRRYRGMRLPRLPRVVPRVVQVILLQLVSWREATTAWRQLALAFGEPAPGPLDLVLPPRVETLATTPSYAMLGRGVLPRQAHTIRRVTQRASAAERMAEGGAESLARALASFPGVGPWTVAYVLGSGLGHPDAVMPNDYNLRHTVGWVLAGEARADEARMLELLEPYRGHRFRVIRMLWMNGKKAPRHGPRLAPRRPW